MAKHTWGRKHRMEPKAVTNFTFESPTYNHTLVLRRCACGKLDTKKLAGTWTLEQVLGDTPSS